MCVIATAAPRTTSAAPSLALPLSDYPQGTVISAYPATNNQADLLLSPAHRSSFERLHRQDGLGWIQAALWFFQTGKGGAKQRHRTTFGYAINVFRTGQQARRALADARIQRRPYGVAHLKGLIFQSSDAVQSLSFLFFSYKNIEVELYYEYRGTAPSSLARSLHHIFSRQASHLVHLARVYVGLMRQTPPTPTRTPSPEPTMTQQPTATPIVATALPATAPPTVPPTDTPTSLPTFTPVPTATPTPAPARNLVVQASTGRPFYAPNSQATVQVQVTADGRPLAAARIAANFGFPGKALSCAALTDQNGLASCSVVVPEEPDGTHVPIAVQIVGPRGEQGSTSTSFIVQGSAP